MKEQEKLLLKDLLTDAYILSESINEAVKDSEAFPAWHKQLEEFRNSLFGSSQALNSWVVDPD